MLNFIFTAFFIIPFFMAVYKTFNGDASVWTELVSATFASSKDAFNICIGLTGILCLWLGLLKIAEESGLTGLISKALKPLFKKIMPEVPGDHPAMGSMIMNIAANVLGLDNAATPMGLKAMEQLQELNKKKDTASNAQILFMVLNSSSITLIPITILMYRAEMGALNPSAVFVPILLATSVATITGFLSVAIMQKLDIFNRVVMAYLLGFAGFIAFVIWSFMSMDEAARTQASSNIGNGVLFSIIAVFIMSGIIKKINVYETFIKGAKEGFEVAVRIIPYLVAMLVAIALLRTPGALDILIAGFAKAVSFAGLNTDFVPALPTAIMKPLSGSGARALMLETMRNYGANSFPAFAASIIQGSTETTFYVLAVYFSAVKISKIRHALGCALLADLAGLTAAIVFAYMFY